MSAPPSAFNAKRTFVALIAAALDRERQRATYGAVAALVGLPNQAVMQGLPKCARNCWVVSTETGEPSGYGVEEISPDFSKDKPLIRSPETLAAWLENHP